VGPEAEGDLEVGLHWARSLAISAPGQRKSQGNRRHHLMFQPSLVSSYVVRWERLGSLSDVVENSKSENEGAAKVGRKVKNHRFLSYQNQHRSGSNGR
jgi:hypothetical protein